MSRPFIGEGTGWETTARFHLWPWPYKFAVISNIPAFLFGLIPSWPIEAHWPRLPEAVLAAPSLPFVYLMWYWIGRRLDRRRRSADKTPWLGLAAFELICLTGALVPGWSIGYTGYLLYGAVLWLLGVPLLAFATRPRSRSVP